MRKYIWQISLLLILSMLTINALAEPGVENKPNQKAPKPASEITGIGAGTITGYSLNWAGYALDSPAGSVTDVKGSWIVPAVICSRRQNAYSSFWVGIDGDTSSTVEQIGTDSDCINGKPTYYAWYEFYPAPMNSISMSVSPGDKISGEVSYNSSNNQFTVSISDQRTGRSYSTTGQVSGAQRNSAEWIAEAPSSDSGILPLANFGTAYYGYDYTKSAKTNYATINGANGNISSFNPSSTVNVNQIFMVTTSSILKARPSSVSTDGTSFAARWYHS